MKSINNLIFGRLPIFKKNGVIWALKVLNVMFRKNKDWDNIIGGYLGTLLNLC